ncbi:MAG: DUF47 domain-containing protein [Actinobacteria bacterium]|nr:MAG: DUF47 domain-containing protein [Actinomycetota bacterium]
MRRDDSRRTRLVRQPGSRGSGEPRRARRADRPGKQARCRAHPRARRRPGDARVRAADGRRFPGTRTDRRPRRRHRRADLVPPHGTVPRVHGCLAPDSASLIRLPRAVARINLVPQNREFFRLFVRASSNAVGIAEQLVRLLDDFPGNDNLLREIKESEHEGDHLTRELVDLLNRTFVTPFDRDDIYNLAGAIDDVCDHVDEAAGNIVGYGVEEIRPFAKQQAQVILRSAQKLDEAVGRLEGFKDSSRQLHDLRDLEDEGDRLNRAAVAELFATAEDPMVVIRWKDIHEQLEEAVDACENAADVLEAILVKNR